MAAQDNTEVSTKFSTLNVNAVEFVPSFNYSSAASAAAVAAAAAQAVVNAPPSSQQQQTQQATPVENTVAPGTGSVPVSGSATPATTPDSNGSAGSTNALNAAGGGVGGGGGTEAEAPSSAAASNSASPAQGSPVTTPSTAAAAPIENINAVDKITANNGKYKTEIHMSIYVCMSVGECTCGSVGGTLG